MLVMHYRDDMRTTVAIDDRLLAAARARARARGTTLGAVLEDALRRDLARDTTATSASAITLPVFREGTGLRAGVDATSNRAMREALDQALAVDELR